MDDAADNFPVQYKSEPISDDESEITQPSAARARHNQRSEFPPPKKVDEQPGPQYSRDSVEEFVHSIANKRQRTDDDGRYVYTSSGVVNWIWERDHQIEHLQAWNVLLKQKLDMYKRVWHTVEDALNRGLSGDLMRVLIQQLDPAKQEEALTNATLGEKGHSEDYGGPEGAGMMPSAFQSYEPRAQPYAEGRNSSNATGNGLPAVSSNRLRALRGNSLPTVSGNELPLVSGFSLPTVSSNALAGLPLVSQPLNTAVLPPPISPAQALLPPSYLPTQTSTLQQSDRSERRDHSRGSERSDRSDRDHLQSGDQSDGLFRSSSNRSSSAHLRAAAPRSSTNSQSRGDAWLNYAASRPIPDSGSRVSPPESTSSALSGPSSLGDARIMLHEYYQRVHHTGLSFTYHSPAEQAFTCTVILPDNGRRFTSPVTYSKKEAKRQVCEMAWEWFVSQRDRRRKA
ncbi:hypothetical protein HDU85_000224 [Gaertneriomyces sp. JEL0708]|nr:hypothetical protein HDU85_000224 [Gaertneriomyces sp. JEL0708]